MTWHQLRSVVEEFSRIKDKSALHKEIQYFVSAAISMSELNETSGQFSQKASLASLMREPSWSLVPKFTLTDSNFFPLIWS